ncbi:MAG: AI-2E family transporter, partial [Bacilli bacterium]
MEKNNINYKVVNIAIIVVILFLFYLSKDLWLDIISTIIKIFTPFIIGFVFAYAFNPLLKYMTNKSINKTISILIISILFIGLITIVIILIIPLLINELSSLFSNIIIFIQNLSTKYNFNTNPLRESLADIFNNTMNNLGNYLSISTINVIKTSISYITIYLISFIIGIYFLFDIDKIRLKIEKYLKYKSNTASFYFNVIGHI